MRQLVILTLALFTLLSCKAQTLPLFKPSDNFRTANAYYKDLDGDLTKLVGTWQYTSGNETFKIILKKQTQRLYDMPQLNIVCYKDALYGEYQYVNTDGVEMVNTLNDINSFNDAYEHLIYGAYIKSKHEYPICEDCTESERRVRVLIEDPERSYYDYEMNIRHVAGDQFGTQEQIKIFIKTSGSAWIPDGGTTVPRLPLYVEITLNKVE